MRDDLQALISKEFVLAALHTGVRVDGRPLDRARPAQVTLGPAHGQAHVALGRTIAVASAAATPVVPTSDRPADGTVTISVEISPAASENAALEFAVIGAQPSSDKAAIRLRSIVERVIRESRAIDTEALCILAGKRVWAVSVDVTVVDAGGNATDAAHLAAMAALLHARRNDVTISGTDVHVHPFTEREPSPLPVHHVPITVTYALFAATPDFPNDIAVLDPSLQEELASDGVLTIALNAHGEVCGLHKAGGLPIEPQLVSRCAQVAADHVVQVTKIINSALQSSSSTFHPLADVRPILAAPEASAVVHEDQARSSSQSKHAGAGVVMDIEEKIRDGFPMWNAVPYDDARPPTLLDTERAASSRPLKEQPDEIMENILWKPEVKDTLKKLEKRDAGDRKQRLSKKNHVSVLNNAKADEHIVDEPDVDEEESDESDDDLMAAFVPSSRRQDISTRNYRR